MFCAAVSSRWSVRCLCSIFVVLGAVQWRLVRCGRQPHCRYLLRQLHCRLLVPCRLNVAHSSPLCRGTVRYCGISIVYPLSYVHAIQLRFGMTAVVLIADV